ncbi:MAG: SpoIID/LytB domain-containing protein [Armatimonadota bacterium]|jgi:SpoIID/LytB domain protein
MRPRLRRLKWVLLASLAFVAGPPERCEGVPPHLRVGLMQHQAEVSFSGPAGVTVEAPSGGKPLATIPANETWVIRPATSGAVLVSPAGAEAGLPPATIHLTAHENSTVTIHGVQGHWDKRTDRDYRGVIEIMHNASGFTVVNLLDVETYLRGVVPSEMPATYPLAALQAQAIAARGQALMKAGRHRAEGFDLCSTQHCQVYGGATSEDPRSDQAVASTSGQVLTYHGRLADTLYSSTCGGHTANNEDYWTDAPPIPYLRGVADFEPEDRVNYTFPLTEPQAQAYLKYAPPVHCNQPAYAKTDKIRWWSVVRRQDLEKTIHDAVGDIGTLMEIRIVSRAPSGLVRTIAIIGTKRLVRLNGGSAIRHALGGINSASFAIQSIPEQNGTPVAFAIWGAGWGHQVGMCQVGAAGLADRGWGYEQILSKYYTGCQVEKRY